MAAGSPEMPNINVAILGCGALGGVMAARLAGREGIALEVYNTNPEIARSIERNGLVLVEGVRRSVVQARLLPPPQKTAGESGVLDLVILATKSVGLVEAARRLLPALRDDGVFVTTQNGLVAQDLVDTLGPQRVVAGSVLWGASMDAPGVYRITAHGPFILGPLRATGGPGAQSRTSTPARDSAAVDRVAAVLNNVFPVVRSDNMLGVLWSKLAIIASLTTLGAITALRFGKLVRRRSTRRILLGLGAEVLAVARSRGVSLEPLGGGLNVERFLSPSGYPPLLKHLLMRIVGGRHRNTESSMLDSLRRGRKTELEFINAYVVRLGEAEGVPCPLNRTAVELVQELEAGKAEPSVDHLRRFAIG
jgi:2-dehydropantoate 2-reductase